MPTPRKTVAPTSQSVISQIAKRIVSFRKTRGLTQAQLADIVGISRNLLANYEMGRTHLTDDSIIRLASALRVSADELLGIKGSDATTASVPSVRLVRRMQKIALLPQADQKVILKTIDTYLKGAVI
jgi:XRE family transcriptional regulator, regulator of sulfur utilization